MTTTTTTEINIPWIKKDRFRGAFTIAHAYFLSGRHVKLTGSFDDIRNYLERDEKPCFVAFIHGFNKNRLIINKNVIEKRESSNYLSWEFFNCFGQGSCNSRYNPSGNAIYCTRPKNEVKFPSKHCCHFDGEPVTFKVYQYPKKRFQISIFKGSEKEKVFSYRNFPRAFPKDVKDALGL